MKPIIKNSKKNRRLPVRKDRFVIPQQFLSALNEFSSGGYVLIVGNFEGDPQVYADFDGGIQGMGLAKFGKDYFTKIDTKFSEAVVGSVEESPFQ